MHAGHTRWWWIRHAPVPDGGKIYGQSDLDCDCTDAEIFSVLARELPKDAVWVVVEEESSILAISVASRRRAVACRSLRGSVPVSF